MRARLENIRRQKDRSFNCFELDLPSFEFFWHFHPEYELTLILEGKGKRLVGDSIQSFREGDLVFIGPHIPHTWVSGSGYRGNCKALVVQFLPSVVEHFTYLKDFSKIRDLCNRASKGLVFSRSKREKMVKLMKDLQLTQGPHQFIAFLQMLDIMTKLKSDTLSSTELRFNRSPAAKQRQHKVLHYIETNYAKEISIQEAARMLDLTETAFCKFFKRMTGKTFSSYVNDIRITHICNQLIDTDDPVGIIATRCGFDNMSYFNRTFLKKMGITPIQFRKQS